MGSSPRDYQWLTSLNGLGDSGCLSVVSPPSDLAAVRDAFGARSAARATDDHPADGSAWFTAADAPPGAVVIAEPYGFQGARSVVLARATQGSRARKAASVCWNERGLVIATFARAGKVVASIDLSADPDFGEESLPAALIRSATNWAADGTEPVWIGAAMVEQYTGVKPAPNLQAGEKYAIEPLPDDLKVYQGGQDVPVALREHPQLVAAITGASPQRQRDIARLAARAAVAQADLEGEATVNEAFTTALGGAPATISPVLDQLVARLIRQRDEVWREELEVESFGSLEGQLIGQQVEALEGVRQLANPDSFSAAVGAAAAMINATALGTPTRDAGAVASSSGRRVESGDEQDRRAELAASILQEALQLGDSASAFVLSNLPRPLTGNARAAAVIEDRGQQRSGAFDEYTFRRD